MKVLKFASDGVIGGKYLWDSPNEHYFWHIVRAIRQHLNTERTIYDAMEEE